MSRRQDYGGLVHLARRFARSVAPGGPGPADEAWARRWLSPAEIELWSRLPGPDRRHGVAVGRRAAAGLGHPDGTGVPRRALAAALLHDAGKLEAALGPVRRSAATVAGLALGRARVAAWAGRHRGWRRRAGLYAAHDRLGAAMLRAAGSDPLVVAWAAEHHLPPEAWTVDPALAATLKAADDD